MNPWLALICFVAVLRWLHVERRLHIAAPKADKWERGMESLLRALRSDSK